MATRTVSTPAPVVQAVMENNEHDSDIERNGLYLDAPDFVPAISDDALNAGVSLNVWELAHIAITQTARDSWMRRINKQIAEFKAMPTVEPVYSVAPASAADAGF